MRRAARVQSTANPRNGVQVDCHLAIETAPVPLAGAALLMALGVPTMSDERGCLVSADDRLADWGFAIIGTGVARDSDFGVHHGSCQRATQQIGPEDLVLIQEAGCCWRWTVDMAITDMSLAPSAVQNLTRGFYNALDCSPPCGEPGLLAQRRAVHFGFDAAQVLEDFLTASTPGRLLGEGIRRCVTRLRRYAHEACDSLFEDGMTRLQDILEQQYADSRCVDPEEQHVTAARRSAALANAETAVPGAGGSTVACFYRQLEPYIDTALAASGSVAYTRLPRRTRPAAVAVLPRRVAVLLYADFLLTHHTYGQPLAFASAVEASVSDLPNACRVAADLWSSGTDPELAWQAAVATVY